MVVLLTEPISIPGYLYSGPRVLVLLTEPISIPPYRQHYCGPKMLVFLTELISIPTYPHRGRQVLVLLTDGKSTDPSDTQVEAARLKQSGVHAIAVGIGSSLGSQELHAIASNSESVITVSAFNDLLSHIQNVKNSYCHCE